MSAATALAAVSCSQRRVGAQPLAEQVVRPSLAAAQPRRVDGPLSGATGAPTCDVTVCLAGAGTPRSGGNPAFARLCAALPGIVPVCVEQTCTSTFKFTETNDALSAAIDVLDANDDGRLDEDDPPCRFNVVGYSWGAVNSIGLIRRFFDDDRVQSGRRVIDRLVVIDAYRPLGKIIVPAGVSRVQSIRHSVSPDNDCSQGSPLGPYRGFVPRCDEANLCTDLDVSKTPDASYPTAHGRSVLGSEVGHCSIVRVATPMVWEFFGHRPRSASPPN